VLIDKAREADGISISALTAKTGVFNADEVACVEELWAAYLRQGEESGYSFLVAREGETVVGYACFGPTPLTHGTFDLYWIVVDPDFWHHRIGHALLDRVEQEVRARGGRLLIVETSSTPPYATARRFYESCGYRYTASIHDFYAPGDDLVTFSKRLSE